MASLCLFYHALISSKRRIFVSYVFKICFLVLILYEYSVQNSLSFRCLYLVDQLLIASERTLGEAEAAKAQRDLRVQMPPSKDLTRMLGAIVGSIVLLAKRLQLYTTRTMPLVDDMCVHYTRTVYIVLYRIYFLINNIFILFLLLHCYCI